MKRNFATLVLVLAVAVASGVVLTGWTGHSRGVAHAGTAAAIKNLAGCTNNSLPRTDDGSSAAIPIGFPVKFFGQTYTTVFVNNNGNVTFDGALGTYTPFSLLSTSQVIIAPFFADVDTRGTSSGVVTYGRDTLDGNAVFCVNWHTVGYFSYRTDKLNDFQLLLIERADQSPGDFDIMMNYNQIQWETGDYSGGTNGLGGDSARVGYSNGSDTAFELPGSAVDGALLDSAGTGLVNNSRNSFINGRYVYQVRNGTAPTGGTIKGTVRGPGPDGNVPLANALVQICLTGGACTTTSTNASGQYQLSPMAAGEYFGTALPPATNPDLFPASIGPVNLLEGGTITVDFKLTRPNPLPPGVTIQNIAQTSTGAPVLNWNTNTLIAIVNQPGCSAFFELIKDGRVIQSGFMTEVSPGTYQGTITPLRPAHGPAQIRFVVNCPNQPSTVVIADVYIDPSGTVRTVGGDPVSGATVTLYRSDSSSGPFAQVPNGDAIMSPSNRNNPDMTNSEGYFHWDVIAGYYKVRAQKAGCHAPGNASQAFVETDVLTIPPPVLDLDLRLDCGGGQGVTGTPTPTRTPTSPSPVAAGDVNCSGNVDSIDAALVLQWTAVLLGQLQCPAAADVNEDGDINSIDAALILQYVAGFLPSL